MEPIINRIKQGIQKLQLFNRVGRINTQIAVKAVPNQSEKPVVFFNASTRLEGLNLNAAFSLISSWGIQLAGREVYHFACRSGMSHCVLGAGLGNPTAPPPCQGCIQYTELFSGGAKTIWFDYQEDPHLGNLINGKSVVELSNLNFNDRPLGDLVMASTRWILRRHHLEDDELTQYLLSEYILSANSIADEFTNLLKDVHPEAVVLFNGLQYPEAVVRWVAQKKGIRVITHEVNLQPYSAIFTDGQATIYPMNIPQDFQLSDQQNQILNHYLERRFQGDFKMAGIKFWSSIIQLPDDFLKFADQFDSLVPVFTNVIFDTSQAHANTIFSNMFEWLDLVCKTAGQHPETLFVIRAHPDEKRTGKSSQESVLSWAAEKGLNNLPNVRLIGPDEILSSYELIQRSKFTIVYNSSIGLEAVLLGKPVLCAGKARYTQYSTVFYPETQMDYENLLVSFLESVDIEVPSEYLDNARKFLFFQLYRASLPFGEFLNEHSTPGYVQLNDIDLENMKPGVSKVIDLIVEGILRGNEFIMEDDQI